MARLVLDSGAIIGLSRGDARMRALVRRAEHDGDLVLVPAVVIAETTRGGPRDAPVNRVLKAVDEIVPITAEIARHAGRLLGASQLSGATVDALVAAVAVASAPAVLLTGDPHDIEHLTADAPNVTVYRI